MDSLIGFLVDECCMGFGESCDVTESSGSANEALKNG